MSNGYDFDDAGSAKDFATNEPVESVDWFDVVKWCNARSQQAGLTPVYYNDAAFTSVYTQGDVLQPYVNWAASGYRLPTEAEWEKAARGGLSGLRFPWGDTISWSQANYFGDGGATMGKPAYDLSTSTGYDPAYSDGDDGDYPYTSPVGSFAANGYGVYDMAGNLWEWCWDWYAGTPYPAGSPYLGGTDPLGPAMPTSVEDQNRVLRCGSWGDSAYNVRTANRSSDTPYDDGDFAGFRCVRAN